MYVRKEPAKSEQKKKSQFDISSEREKSHRIQTGIEKGQAKKERRELIRRQQASSFSMMNRDREFKRCLDYLNTCKIFSNPDSNRGLLIDGYIEYLSQYGSSMSPYDLREFKRMVITVLDSVAREDASYSNLDEYEDVILDYIAEYHELFSDEYGYFSIPIGPLISELRFLDCKCSTRAVKEKVKSMYEELGGRMN